MKTNFSRLAALGFILITLLGLISFSPATAQVAESSLSYPKNGEIAYANTDSLYLPWTRKEAIIPIWIDLANQHGGTYESIGKSSASQNWDIIAFQFGTTNKPGIMITAHLHGNEHYGYEVMYALANWLVSNDTTAKSILENNYVIFVPVVDYRWARTNYNYQSGQYDDGSDLNSIGVDLNRNFAPSWTSNLTLQDHNQYGGIAADSEPETQALINAWEKYQPLIFWNLHQGSTRVYTECTTTTAQENATLKKLKNILPTVTSNLNVTGPLFNFIVNTAYGMGYNGYGKGYAIDGAASHGVLGLMSELKTGWNYNDEIRADLNSGETFKQAKVLFIALAQSTGTASPDSNSTESALPKQEATFSPVNIALMVLIVLVAVSIGLAAYFVMGKYS
ncbi:MAG: M14 family zinc carboxypeptidase [Candidatus Bathyarchaeia archaeon]|jgi:hypothetical protein